VRQAVRRASRPLALLVLTPSSTGNLLVRAVQAGARGYVVRMLTPLSCWRDPATSAGESAFDSRSAAAEVRSLSGRTGPRRQLTDREIELLFNSAMTVKFHVSNIMRKFEASRRVEAVYAAVGSHAMWRNPTVDGDRWRIRHQPWDTPSPNWRSW
jgi:two-component system, NarL family, response regulator DevR